MDIRDIQFYEVSLMPDGSYEPGYTYKKPNMKVACTGTSGSGKTTLVKFIAEELGLKHISGSAGDLKSEVDKAQLEARYNFKRDQGHQAVIKKSAENPFFGFMNQQMNLAGRRKLIEENTFFVTDRSPVDNLTYCIAQCGFHKEIPEAYFTDFAKDCLEAWRLLTHVIYIKAVQPGDIENNGSRINNKWYQRASDAQFEYWLLKFFIPSNPIGTGPQILIIDFWNLEQRKLLVKDFLQFK